MGIGLTVNSVPGAEFRQIVGAGGNSIRVAVQGEGPLVLMVHGFPESWFSWRHQLPAIAAAGFTAAAMDVRGYGGSAKPVGFEQYTLVKLAGDIAAVIDGLGATSAILVGHDWGAPQVYTAALLFPHKVRALAGLSAPAGNFVDRKPSSGWQSVYGDDFYYHRYFWTPGVAEAEIEKDPHRFVRVFYHGMSGDSDGRVNPLWQGPGVADLLGRLAEPKATAPWLSVHEIDYYAQSFIEGGMTAPLNRYRAADLDVDELRPFGPLRIEQPALFIAGERDPARWMLPGFDRYASPVDRFADPRGVHILERAGHWIQQEAADAVNAHLLRFLRDVSR